MAALTPDVARTGVNGLVIATISKYGVIIGKPINPAYSGTDEPWVASGGLIQAPQGGLSILGDVLAGIFAIVRIRCAIRTYGLKFNARLRRWQCITLNTNTTAITTTTHWDWKRHALTVPLEVFVIFLFVYINDLLSNLVWK
jgi:hypothetical protein